MLPGLKTYIVAAVAVLSALLGFFAGDLTLLQTASAIGIALGLGGNRAVLAVAEKWSDPRQIAASPTGRLLITYAGVALAILTAILAGLNGEQSPAVTIATILGALGLNFLGLGAKKAVQT